MMSAFGFGTWLGSLVSNMRSGLLSPAATRDNGSGQLWPEPSTQGGIGGMPRSRVLPRPTSLPLVSISHSKEVRRLPYHDPRFDLRTSAMLRRLPFPHATFAESSLLSRADVDKLVATFPAAGTLVDTRRTRGSDKTYEVSTLTLHDRGQWSAEYTRLDACWRELADYLVHSRYRLELAELLGVPPGPIELELRLTEYMRGGWMSRHTDRPEKLFTQNIYFCPGWQPEWGGSLALYDDRDATQPTTLFFPAAGNALAFARSDLSWHEVIPVTKSARAPRRALLLHGYRPVSRR